MNTLRSLLAAFLLAGSLGSAPTQARSLDCGDDDFGWAIIGAHGRSITGNLNKDDRVPKRRDLYDREFLYIRDGNERYVITDRGSIRDAREAGTHISRYSKEIGELASAEARLALAHVGEDRRPELVKRRRDLERQIEAMERRDEPTDHLEEELFQVSIELKTLDSMRRSNQLTEEERRDLLRRKDRASSRVDKGIREIHAELRQILADAKARGLAERVGDR